MLTFGCNIFDTNTNVRRMMQFNPGFRLSKLDIGVITVSFVLASFLYQYSRMLCFITLFVVAHFFLFCNVARMSRIPELIWAGVFIVCASTSLKFGVLSVEISVGISLFTTALLIALEVQKPSYHGVYWQKLNPNLEKWFENNCHAR